MEDRRDKKQKGRWKRLIAFFVIFVAGLLGTFVFRDDLIINMGLSIFRLLQIGCIAGTAVTGVIGGVFGVTTISQLQDQAAIERQKELFISENRRKEAANLSVKDKLENARLRDMLREKYNQGWSVLGDSITKCTNQLEQMDSYQERLSRLLQTNDVHTLSDTEEILDRVEQYICRNVRKVLNYMEVVDPTSPEDVELVKTKFTACCGDNQDQLKQTQEFIIALTDFINQQGDSDNDLSMLEVYKNTILDSIQD